MKHLILRSVNPGLLKGVQGSYGNRRVSTRKDEENYFLSSMVCYRRLRTHVKEEKTLDRTRFIKTLIYLKSSGEEDLGIFVKTGGRGSILRGSLGRNWTVKTHFRIRL